MATYLNIIEEDELPTMQMCPDGNIHVLNRCPLQPPPRLLQCLYPPHPSSSIKTKEVDENPINLLLHFKMK